MPDALVVLEVEGVDLMQGPQVPAQGLGVGLGASLGLGLGLG